MRWIQPQVKEVQQYLPTLRLKPLLIFFSDTSITRHFNTLFSSFEI